MSIAVLGAGAFGTALAVALARADRPVTLVARSAEAARNIRAARMCPALPDALLPETVAVADEVPDNTAILLLAIPMQALAAGLAAHRVNRSGLTLVACCKGIEQGTGRLPSAVMRETAPATAPALLSGPSFAVDIAAGLPTALTIAAPEEAQARALQDRLATPVLRLYRTTDMTGVELGGALKNVIAIACGMAIGAGLGESARAALMTRGYAEMSRLALARGGWPETLAGLSGFGDLALTCTSEKSRNYAFGLRLGRAGQAEPTGTTEGFATARAAAALAAATGTDMPITAAIAAVLDGRMHVAEAADALLARPLRAE